MTTETVKRNQTEAKETREVTFRCKYCGRTWPLADMKTLTRFFPPLIACRDCAEKMQ